MILSFASIMLKSAMAEPTCRRNRLASLLASNICFGVRSVLEPCWGNVAGTADSVVEVFIS